MVATNIENRKMALIRFIITLKHEDAVAAFEQVVPRVKKRVQPTKKAKKNELNLAHFARPIRETITIEELMREQQFTVFDREGFDQIVKNMDIQEPIEELLAQLTA
jgi:DNA repair photolyase